MPMDRQSSRQEYYVEVGSGSAGAISIETECRMVSFVVPTMNSERTLEAALSSFAGQDFPRKELIVVDGGSVDRTLEIAGRFVDEVLVVHGPCGLAVLRGIERSRGDFIALFDSDVVLPSRTWLSGAVRLFEVSDRISTVWPLNIPPPSAALLTKTYFRHWTEIVENRLRSQKGLLGGGNSLYRAELIASVAPLAKDVHWGDDFVRSRELRRRGYKVAVYRDPILHNTMVSIAGFYRKQRAGAHTFVQRGFETMGLTARDVLFEQYVLGASSMVKGLLSGDVSALLFPPYMLARTLAYGKESARAFLSKWHSES